MGEQLRIRTLVASKTLTLSVLDRYIGKRVEVTVREDDGAMAEPPRKLGTLKGQIAVSPDFDAPMAETSPCPVLDL